ncbi:PEP-CTERM sorting domain-containing protein [Methyloversatilis thermotolerans]|uniref:PEP-CTERM sorting domain-containing protein n=1 Tax=Methyloversatilis thermotolerans TaxID=1346290 RepID=UPI0003A09637|nr:PEP-CTERM sorting domain-containing protein [Methyloversatilis thermotolerans]
MHLKKTLATAFAGGILAISSMAAHAESWYSSYTTSFDVSGYAEWDVFSTASGQNAPDVATNLSGAWVQEHSGTSFITGGGNIYSFAMPTDFTLYAPTASGTGTRDVVLRIMTLGTALDLSSITLGGLTYDSYSLLGSETLGGMGGEGQELVFVWNDVANADGLTFDFNALGSSMSLARASVYYSSLESLPAVPEPSTWATMIAGLGLLAAIGRRRLG